MADFSTLIASIEETIKTNGVQAITGQILQDEMLLMVSAINQLKQDTLEGYAFYGQPLADGGSASVTQNTFFLVGRGTYTINGNSVTIANAGVSVIVYDSVAGSVTSAPLFPYDETPTLGSENAITSGAVAAALAENPANFAACLYDRRSAGTPQSPYTFRQSGGDGVDYLKRIKGKTLAWNQKVNVVDQQQQTKVGVTVSVVNGIISLNGTATSNGNITFDSFTAKPIVANHKYYLFARTNVGQYEYAARAVGSEFIFDRNIMTSEIITASGNSGAFYSSFRWYTGNVFNNVKVFVPQCIDLTLMFGAGNEPSTVAEFEALFPLPYYSYTPASLINNAATALESTGFNQWDEEWEVGGISQENGTNITNTSLFRSKNYIPCFPGSTYYFHSGTNDIFGIRFYDAAKNFIGFNSVISPRTYTMPANTRFLRFVDVARNTYNHDICINLSDPSRNGTYEPYWKATRHLGLDNLQAKEVGSDTIVTINGLDGVGDNVDLLKDGKYIEKNRARVDLGSLTWGYNSTDAYFYANLSGKAAGMGSIACAKYAVTTAILSSLPDKSIRGHASNNALYIKDSAYSDPAAFKTAMAGVMLDYPLATPKEYELVEPIQPMLEVDELGTERRLPEDTADAVNAPFESDSNYSVSVANLVRKLSE